MDYKNPFEKFNEGGKPLLPNTTIDFDTIPWSKYPTFEGVELKHIITSIKTDGQFIFHLVRIAPNKKIGNHIHEKQLEPMSKKDCPPDNSACEGIFGKIKNEMF